MGYKDRWKRKQGDSWVPCESPTRQNLRHARLFAKWLRAAKIPLPAAPKELVCLVVLFTCCWWLKAEECSICAIFEKAKKPC